MGVKAGEERSVSSRGALDAIEPDSLFLFRVYSIAS